MTGEDEPPRTGGARIRRIALVAAILFATVAVTLPIESFVSDDAGSRGATLSGAWREAAWQRVREFRLQRERTAP